MEKNMVIVKVRDSCCEKFFKCLRNERVINYHSDYRDLLKTADSEITTLISTEYVICEIRKNYGYSSRGERFSKAHATNINLSGANYLPIKLSTNIKSPNIVELRNNISP